MKQKMIISIIFLLFVSACGAYTEDDRSQINIFKKEKNSLNESKSAQEGVHLEKELAIVTKNEKTVFLVSDLVELLDGDYNYDELHRLLTIDIDDQQFKIVKGIPVVEHNGIYLATDEIFAIKEEDAVFLPVVFLEIALGLTVSETSDIVLFDWGGQALLTSVTTHPLISDQEWSVDKMVNYLSFLEKPIEGAEVSTLANHLPGAKRGYRNGFHEGLDWYGYATVRTMSFDTPVYAMAEGTVVRVDHDYEEYKSPLIRNKDLSLTAELGETPLYIFDRLRGRQVWIQYEKGIMNRFAHLDDIPESLKVGDKVTSKTIIGYVGNSGTSGAVNKDGTELHLHQDILIYGDLFWKPFSLDEVTEILVRVFGD
jgi:murein DD-endopeptidase MepM/ murein hydrolase activator NlpD